MSDTLELKGLALRKAVCEALGYEQCEQPNEAFWFKPDIQAKRTAFEAERLPAIESDPAISEGELDKLCEERGWWWDIRRITANGVLENYVCRIGWPYRSEAIGQRFSVIRFGESASEARARAILAALKESK